MPPATFPKGITRCRWTGRPCAAKGPRHYSGVAADAASLARAARTLAAEGISAEVLDVRSLSPLDYETIGDSVKKTGRVVIVEEGPKTGGVERRNRRRDQERFGDHLPPRRRVASPDVPVPFSPVLENAYRPDVPRIVAAVRVAMKM